MTKSELKTQIEKLQAEYDAMPDDVVLNGRADIGGTIYFLDEALDPINDTDTDAKSDNHCHKIGNYYLTKSVANRAAAYYKKWGQFNRVAFELMEIDPEVDCAKYAAEYNMVLGEWEVTCWDSLARVCLHFFHNEETAQRLADWANQNMPEG